MANATLTTDGIRNLIMKRIPPKLRPDGEPDENDAVAIIGSIFVALSERLDNVSGVLGLIIQKVDVIEQALVAGIGAAPAAQATSAPGTAAAKAPAATVAGSADEFEVGPPVDSEGRPVKPTPSYVTKVEPLQTKAPDKVEPLSPIVQAPPKAPRQNGTKADAPKTS